MNEITQYATPAEVVAFLMDGGNDELLPKCDYDEPWTSLIAAMLTEKVGARGRIFEALADKLGDGTANQVRMAVYAASRKRMERLRRQSLDVMPPALEDEKSPIDIKEAYRKREMGDAELFARLYAGQVMHDHSNGLWYLWSGQNWEQDRVRAIVPLVSEQLTAQYYHVLREAQKAGEDELAKRYAKRIEYLCSRRYLDNVLTLAATLPTMRITGDEWDCDPWVLGVSNGVVDLQDGSFRPGHPDDMIQFKSPAEWLGLSEPAPRWMQFLDEVFRGNQEIINYLQRLLGYGITGLSTEHVFPVLWGSGRNGKSTLLETLATVLGEDLASSIPSDVLMMSRSYNNAPQPFLYAMRSKRMVWATETKQARWLDAGMVKWLTGGDRLKVRTLHARPVEFKPSHLLLLLTNFKPRAPSEDLAIWDRAALIPFEMRFVQNPQAENELKQDKNLVGKLAEEGPGILAWLVKGCLIWRQRGGLFPPDVVQMATSEYQSEEDTIAQWIEDSGVIQHPGATIGSSEAYQHYFKWCKSLRLPAFGSKQFSQRLAQRYEKKHTMTGKTFVGIGLPMPGPMFAQPKEGDL